VKSTPRATLSTKKYIISGEIRIEVAVVVSSAYGYLVALRLNEMLPAIRVVPCVPKIFFLLLSLLWACASVVAGAYKAKTTIKQHRYNAFIDVSSALVKAPTVQIWLTGVVKIVIGIVVAVVITIIATIVTIIAAIAAIVFGTY